ncbi:MAG: hypothetical protein ACJA0X_001967 [Cyclobacteriaceae bacterium]|jgi:hypothetical protein
MKRKMKELLMFALKPYNKLRYGNKQKIFCIGKNKTGTTSMSAFLKTLGFKVAPQRPAELLIHDWGKRNFSNIINYVKVSGVAFQDIPFSLAETYQVMDSAFPNSKFILTVRDSPETWYHSLTSFHSKLFGNGHLPTKEDLQNVDYMYKGFAWELNRLIHSTPESDPYNKKMLIQEYIEYNDEVITYFQNMPKKLLVINLKEENAHQQIADFLGHKGDVVNIPWVNKT